MKNYILFLIFIISCSTNAQQYSLNGQVFDTGNKETLIGVGIKLLPINKRTTTDVNGKYSFDSLSSGTYIIKFLYLGYFEYTDTLEISGEPGNKIKNVFMAPLPKPVITYTDTTISGMYKFDFEYSGLRPCNSSNEAWQITANRKFSEKYWLIQSKIPKNPKSFYGTSEVFVIVKGKMSNIGRFGHSGAYRREFIVEKVIEMRLPGKQDCDKNKK